MGSEKLRKVAGIVAENLFFNQGQICSAPSRIVVHRSVIDAFVTFLQTKAIKKNLKIYSFSLKRTKSYTHLVKTLKIKNKFKIYVKVGSKVSYYYSKSNSKSHIQNLLAALTIISIFFNLKDIRKDIFSWVC